MLQYEVTKKLYDEIKEKMAKTTKEGFDEFHQDFLQDAIDYATTRASWSCMDRTARTINDKGLSSRCNTV